MKRILFPLLLAALICLTACQPIPTATSDGGSWDDDWITIGGIVGVDTPTGIDPLENSDTLSLQGMYYATWSIGASEPYTNEDGNDVQLYDAQIYFLLAGYDTAEKAGENAVEWQSMADERYTVSETLTQTCGGQEFTVLAYSFDSDTNPYANGVSAFGIYRNYAISVELSCREGFTGDPLEILTDFLNHCHYSA